MYASITSGVNFPTEISAGGGRSCSGRKPPSSSFAANVTFGATLTEPSPHVMVRELRRSAVRRLDPDEPATGPLPPACFEARQSKDAKKSRVIATIPVQRRNVRRGWAAVVRKVCCCAGNTLHNIAYVNNGPGCIQASDGIVQCAALAKATQKNHGRPCLHRLLYRAPTDERVAGDESCPFEAKGTAAASPTCSLA